MMQPAEGLLSSSVASLSRICVPDGNRGIHDTPEAFSILLSKPEILYSNAMAQ
jgi:hypothetical protein